MGCFRVTNNRVVCHSLAAHPRAGFFCNVFVFYNIKTSISTWNLHWNCGFMFQKTKMSCRLCWEQFKYTLSYFVAKFTTIFAKCITYCFSWNWNVRLALHESVDENVIIMIFGMLNIGMLLLMSGLKYSFCIWLEVVVCGGISSTLIWLCSQKGKGIAKGSNFLKTLIQV